MPLDALNEWQAGNYGDVPVDAGATTTTLTRPHFSPEVERYRAQAEQDLGNPSEVDAYLKSLDGGNTPSGSERERQRRLRIQGQQQADTQAVLATQTAPLSLAEKFSRTASPLSAYSTIADALTPAPVANALEATQSAVGDVANPVARVAASAYTGGPVADVATALGAESIPGVGSVLEKRRALLNKAGEAGGSAAESLVPTTLPDAALMALPLVGKAGEAATAGRGALDRLALKGLESDTLGRAPEVAGADVQALARKAESLPEVAGGSEVSDHTLQSGLNQAVNDLAAGDVSATFQLSPTLGAGVDPGVKVSRIGDMYRAQVLDWETFGTREEVEAALRSQFGNDADILRYAHEHPDAVKNSGHPFLENAAASAQIDARLAAQNAAGGAADVQASTGALDRIRGEGSPPKPPSAEQEAVVPPSGSPPKSVPPGIEAALSAKAEATLEPGRIFGPEGSVQRKVVGALNPSVDMPQDIHVANQARVAVTAAQRTEWASAETPAYKKLASTFEDTKPAYTGPEGRPAANTWIDYAENPRFYQASPELTAAKEELRSVQDQVIGKAKSDFGVDVNPYQSPVDPEAVYVPHMQSRESMDNAIARTEASLSSKRSIAKERAYDSLSDRMARHPDFQPETDPATLADLHSSSLASMSGANTFKQGVGGKTLTEVMDETHPGLRESKDKMAQAVQNARARIDAAENRAVANDSALAPLLKEQAAVTDRAVPKYVSLAEADRMTPELRDMQAQLRELRVRATSLDNAVAKVQGRQAANALNLKADIKELSDLQPQLDELRSKYHSAAPGDYVQGKDYRYHTPERAQAIESVTKTGFNNAFIDGAIEAGNTARAAGLGPDFSPLTIQGGLGALSHPEVAIKNAAGLVKAAFSTPESMLKDLGPDVVKRFEFANNRRLGSLSEEVLGNKGIQLPGRPVKKFNDALNRVVDYGSVKAWENDTNLLVKLGMESQNVADHEAANSLSKLIPRLNNYETGRSVQRVKLEGVLPTSRSFTAQPFSLAKDYASALVKIPLKQELLGREKLALIRGTTLVGTLATISVGSALAFAEANGKDPVEAVKEVTDPSSGKFLHLIVGDKGSVPLGGPLRSAFLGVFRTATQGPEGGYNYVKGRFQPQIGAAVETATNHDFQGNPVRSGSGWDQTLQMIMHQAQAANLITGGTIEGYQKDGVSGAVTQGAAQIAGQNYTERSPTESRDALAVQLTGKHYNEIPPEDRKIFDARPEVMATQEGKDQSKYQQARAAGETSIPIQEARRAEKSFKSNTPTAKALPEYWADENIARLQMSHDLERQFASTFANFDKSKYDKAVEGYYQQEASDANGNHDFEATDVARQKYLVTLPADQQEWIKQALEVTAENKTPEHQSYLNYLKQKEDKGYFAPDVTPAQKTALDVANPTLDVQQWYWRGNVQSSPGGEAKPGPALNSTAAVEQALALDPKRPVTFTGTPRAVNATPQSLEYWQRVGPRIEFYENGGTPEVQADVARQLSGRQDYRELSPADQAKKVKTEIRNALAKDPDFEATLLWWGIHEKTDSAAVYNSLLDIVKNNGPMYRKAQ